MLLKFSMVGHTQSLPSKSLQPKVKQGHGAGASHTVSGKRVLCWCNDLNGFFFGEETTDGQTLLLVATHFALLRFEAVLD